MEIHEKNSENGALERTGHGGAQLARDAAVHLGHAVPQGALAKTASKHLLKAIEGPPNAPLS